MTLQNPSLLLALATLVACGGNVGTIKDDDTGSVTDDTADTGDTVTDTSDTQDTGTDTGMDTADSGRDTSDTADTGADTGTDTAVTWNGITGGIQYRSDVDGDVICDADIDFSGTPYTGDCNDCTFGFNIDASVTDDRGTSDCELNPVLSYVPSGAVSNLAMLYWETFEYSGYYGSATYYGLWGTAFEYSYYGYAYSDSEYLGADGFGNEMIVDGADVSWSVVDSTTEYIYGPTGPVTGGEVATGELDTASNTVDAWQFTTDGASDVTLTVDTVDTATAFDAYFIVYDEAQCEATTEDDVFDCTYPYLYQCPGVTFLAPAAGTWTVAVGAYGSAGATAAYSIAVTGATGLSLVGDELADTSTLDGECTSSATVDDTATVSTTTLTVTGTGTLLR